MSVCDKCGVSVADGQHLCDNCSKPATSDNVELHHQIASLHAEATLQRTWGQYDDAIDTCMRILALDADNAAAQSLLGDLHRDKGNFQDALGWYKSAVQLNPSSSHDRRRLDEMIDRVFKGAAASIAVGAGVAGAMHINNAPAALHAPKVVHASKLAKLLANIHPVHVVVTCVVLGVLVMLPFALSSIKSNDRPRPSGAATGLAPGVTGQQPNAGGSATSTQTPEVTPPNPDAVENNNVTPVVPGIVQYMPDQKPPTTATPRNNNTTAPPPSIYRQPTSPEVKPYQLPGNTSVANPDLDKQTDLIRAAMDRAIRESKLQFTLDRLTVDPRNNNVSVEYTVPNVGGKTETKQALLYAGFHLAWAADGVTPVTVTLRGYAYPEGGRQTTIALVAEVNSQQAEAAKTANNYTAVQTYLTSPWWHPELANVPL